MNKKTVRFISIFFYLYTLQTMCEQTTTDHSITVFVHGTYPMSKILRNSPFRKLMYCPQGLSLAKELPADYHFHTIAQGCVDLNPSLYSLDQFYVFGWPSEKIYDSIRQQAACDLVNALQTTVNNYYAQHGIEPKIRLIGFSHGGNVVLNTANFLTQLVQEEKIITEITNERWGGVKIILEGGKALKEKRSEIEILFKDGSKKIFNIEIEKQRDAYEIMLEKAYMDEILYFVSNDEIIASWKFIDSVIKNKSRLVLKIYKKDYESN